MVTVPLNTNKIIRDVGIGFILILGMVLVFWLMPDPAQHEIKKQETVVDKK